MNKNKIYLEYEEHLNYVKHLQKLKKLNVVLIPKKHFKGVGIGLIVVGILTIPIPFITTPLILFGIYLLGLSKYHILEELERKWRISKLRRLMK